MTADTALGPAAAPAANGRGRRSIARRVLGVVAYPALGLFTFVLVVHFTFPYERLRERAVAALSSDYDVTIDEIGPGWIPGHVVVRGLTLKTRPEREGDKPTVLTVERVEVSIGLFAAIGGALRLDIEAQVGGGAITGTIEKEGARLAVDLETSGLPLESVPGITTVTGGAPIKGGLHARIALNLPKGKWRDAQGSISITCDDCVMGDGVAKMRPTAPKAKNAFSEEGFTLPPTRLGHVEGKIRVVKGVACIDTFSTKSGDGEMALEGGLRFEDPFARSQAQLYIRYQLSEEYKSKNEGMAMLDKGVPTQARRSDGMSGYFARDPISQLLWKPGATPLTPMRECLASAEKEKAPDKTEKPDKVKTSRAAAPRGRPNTPPARGVGVPINDLNPVPPREVLPPTLPPAVEIKPEPARLETKPDKVDGKVDSKVEPLPDVPEPGEERPLDPREDSAHPDDGDNNRPEGSQDI